METKVSLDKSSEKGALGWLAGTKETRISDHALQILSSEKCKESITPQTWRLKTGNG